MADVQLEDGYTSIAHELLEAIARADFSKREYKVLLTIARKTYGWNKKDDRISLSQFEQATGIKKNHLTTTLKSLVDKKVVLKRDLFYGVNKDFEQWEMDQISLEKESRNRTIKVVPKRDQSQNGTSPETVPQTSPVLGEVSPETGLKTSPKTVTTITNKTTNTKETKTSKKKSLIGIDEILAKFPQANRQHVEDWLLVRKTKRAPLTETSWEGVVREIEKSGLPGEVCLQLMAEKPWQGFKAAWLVNTQVESSSPCLRPLGAKSGGSKSSSEPNADEPLNPCRVVINSPDGVH